jgi:hypothetical protein
MKFTRMFSLILLALVTTWVTKTMAVEAALGESTNESDKCDYKKMKIDKRIVADMLSLAFEENCPSSMDSILKGEKAEDIYNATAGFTKKALKSMTKAIQNGKGKTEDDPEAKVFQEQLKTLGIVANFLKEKCPTESVVSNSCKAKKAWTTFAQSLQKIISVALAEEEKANQKEALKNDPQAKFKLKFCQNPNLLAVAFFSQAPIEKNCIYSLAPQGYQLTVMQSVPGGIIVGAQNGPTNGKQIFINTKRQYADGDLIQPQFVRPDGLKKYMSVVGAQKTINSFQYLGDGQANNEE